MSKTHLRCAKVVERVHQITSRGSLLLHQCVFIHICHKEEERAFRKNLAVCTQPAPKWQWHGHSFSSVPHGCSALLKAFYLGMLFRRVFPPFLDSWWFSSLYACTFTRCGGFSGLLLGSLLSFMKVALCWHWISHFQMCVTINAVSFWTKE